MNAVQRKVAPILPLVDGDWFRAEMHRDYPDRWADAMAVYLDAFLDIYGKMDLNGLQLVINLDKLSKYAVDSGDKMLLELIDRLPGFTFEAFKDGKLPLTSYEMWGYTTMSMIYLLISHSYPECRNSDEIPEDLMQFQTGEKCQVDLWLDAINCSQ